MSLLYFAPEALMPLASAAVAVVGAVLLFWRRIVAATRAGFGRLFRRADNRSNPAAESPPPVRTPGKE